MEKLSWKCRSEDALLAVTAPRYYKQMMMAVSYQFALPTGVLLPGRLLLALHGCRAAAGARLDESGREGAEGRTGAGRQPRVRAVKQPFPVLSFETFIHRLQVELPHHFWGRLQARKDAKSHLRGGKKFFPSFSRRASASKNLLIRGQFLPRGTPGRR